MMPITLSTAVPRISAAAPTSAPVVTEPRSNAGTMTREATRPITNALATVIAPNSALPTTANVNIRHCSRMPIPRTRRPRASTSVDVLDKPSPPESNLPSLRSDR
jgi:hypothetical protein